MNENIETVNTNEIPFTPVVGEYYEFSDNESNWVNRKLGGFSIACYEEYQPGIKEPVNVKYSTYKFIRPLTKTVSIEIPVDEELQKQIDEVIRVWRSKQ